MIEYNYKYLILNLLVLHLYCILYMFLLNLKSLYLLLYIFLQINHLIFLVLEVKSLYCLQFLHLQIYLFQKNCFLLHLNKMSLLYKCLLYLKELLVFANLYLQDFPPFFYILHLVFFLSFHLQQHL